MASPGRGKAPSFLESIANERSDDPLINDSPSARIRRAFFHGETLTPEMSREFGGSHTLAHVVAKRMMDFGFEFETGGGKARLLNRDHVPTEMPPPKLRPKNPVPAAPREEQPAMQSSLGRAGTKADAVRSRLLAKDPLTARQVFDEMGVSSDSFRKVVRQLEAKGYVIEHEGDVRVWRGRMKPGGKATKRTTAVATTPLPRVVPVGNGRQPDFNDGVVDTPLPNLGQNVQIVGQWLNEDGTVSLGLRNGIGSWLVRIDAHASSVAEG